MVKTGELMMFVKLDYDYWVLALALPVYFIQRYMNCSKIESSGGIYCDGD